MLTVLNSALDKILERAKEFCTDEKELNVFLANRDRAKARLLDALLSRKSNFLSNMYSNAFLYADMLRKKVADAYAAAQRSVQVANVIAERSVTGTVEGRAQFYSTKISKVFFGISSIDLVSPIFLIEN